jgi:Domain of unknown function (DUF4390)
MDFFMQLWIKSISIVFCLVLAGCAHAPEPALTVRSAGVSGGVLNARLQWHPDASVLAALDNGIALDFTVTLRAQGASVLGWHRTLATWQRHLELRYYPLSRQYQWRDLDRGETRSYAARALLIAALEDLRLPMSDFGAAGAKPDFGASGAMPDFGAAGAQRFVFDIALDRNALPGALRLPALLRPAWQLSSGDYAWPAPGA